MAILDTLRRHWECLVIYVRTQEHCNTPAGLYLDWRDPKNWEIGPIMDGVNYSQGLALHPAAHPQGIVLELPYPSQDVGSAHYITLPVGSLVGKSKIRMVYRIETADGARIIPCKFPDGQASMSLYFQRKGLKWTEAFEAWRWWASFATHHNLAAGEFVMEAPLDANWTATLTSSRVNNPTAFNKASEMAGRIGFTLGGPDGLGHGIYASGAARIVVTEFAVL